MKFYGVVYYEVPSLYNHNISAHHNLYNSILRAICASCNFSCDQQVFHQQLHLSLCYLKKNWLLYLLLQLIYFKRWLPMNFRDLALLDVLLFHQFQHCFWDQHLNQALMLMHLNLLFLRFLLELLFLIFLKLKKKKE